MAAQSPGAGVGSPAPLFALPSVQGSTVELRAFQGHRNVIVWFSRGFTCPYCLDYMGGIGDRYEELVGAETEVIQIAPNLLESARSFFPRFPWPFPFVCDPDKRLYAVYGLGDRGALEATRTAVVSFSHAVATGRGQLWVQGAWHDVVNRNFVRRLHHHAMTALEQGIFLVDKAGIVRHRQVVGSLDSIPDATALAGMVRAHCAEPAAP